jgi:hypothetical protein
MPDAETEHARPFFSERCNLTGMTGGTKFSAPAPRNRQQAWPSRMDLSCYRAAAVCRGRAMLQEQQRQPWPPRVGNRRWLPAKDHAGERAGNRPTIRPHQKQD